MSRRWSLELRLAFLCSTLLLGGLASLGAALWFGVAYNMRMAVDGLLEARAASLAQFMESEFGNVFIPSQSDKDAGEFRGPIETVSAARDSIVMRGTEIRLTKDTEFEGSLVPGKLRPGQFAEVEVRRAGAGSPWVARTAAVVEDVRKEIKETVGEYAVATPDGRLMQLWSADGEVILAGLDMKQRTAPARESAPRGFSTFETDDGPYRTLDRQIRVAGEEYRLRISSPLGALLATRRGLLRWAWWALPTMVLLSVCGGFLISRSALRPLESFAGVARRVDVHRLSERLQRSGSGDVIDRLATTFNSMLDRLEASVQRLEQFTADASHELRSPVSVIRTTAELALRQGRTDQDLRNDVSQIHAEAVNLSELIEDLLTLARADSPEHVPAMTAVAIRPMLAQLVTQFAAGQQAESRLRVEAPAGDCFVRGDAGSIRRLMVILVDNALRHNPGGTNVAVLTALERDRGMLRISVSDTGRGIPSHEIAKLFDRFYRGDQARSQSNGYGLGLAIAKWIAQCHGTEIAVSSIPGQGSTFGFSLAVCDSAPEERQELRQRGAAAGPAA